MLNLYRYYKDIFQLNQVALLVLDECHHAGTGDHGYCQFLDEMYWKADKKSRPRVLGLSASPCVNFSDKDELKQKFGKTIY